MTKLAILSIALLACACKKPPLAVQTESTAGHASGSAACEESPPNTPAHCECLGGYVKGDIGDGKVACEAGEKELERVQQGIEGAVCCSVP
jgi:hypothetical protein